MQKKSIQLDEYGQVDQQIWGGMNIESLSLASFGAFSPGAPGFHAPENDGGSPSIH